MTVGRFRDRGDGPIEAGKGEGLETTIGPRDGIRRVVDAHEIATNVYRIIIAEDSVDRPLQARQRRDLGGVRVEEGHAGGLVVAETGEVSSYYDPLGDAIGDKVAHGLDRGVGLEDGGEDAIGQARQQALAAICVERALSLALELVKRYAGEVAGKANLTERGDIDIEV